MEAGTAFSNIHDNTVWALLPPNNAEPGDDPDLVWTHVTADLLQQEAGKGNFPDRCQSQFAGKMATGGLDASGSRERRRGRDLQSFDESFGCPVQGLLEKNSFALDELPLAGGLVDGFLEGVRWRRLREEPRTSARTPTTRR